MHNTLALVLAGGRGNRLGVLTARRAKPAVPIAGALRIIDFTLSNCLNSGIGRVGVLTQYLASSLGPALEVWGGTAREMEIRALAANGDVGYAGTADAAWQNRDVIRSVAPADVVVLAADHVYAMDYSAMLAEHRVSRAKVTVGCVEVPLEDADAFGVMTVDEDGWVSAFSEKPVSPQPVPNRPDRSLVSMGIYVFETAFLLDVLANDAARLDSAHDFGHNVIPAAVFSGGVRAYRFRDIHRPDCDAYWRDVGTLDSYWRTNLELAVPTGPIDVHDPAWPLRSSLTTATLPRVRPRRARFTDSIVYAGCVPGYAEIHRSVLFPGVRVGWGSRLEDCVALPGAHIAPGCTVRAAILEEGCRLPRGTVIGLDPNADRHRYHVTAGGVTVVTSAAVNRESQGVGHRLRSAIDLGKPVAKPASA